MFFRAYENTNIEEKFYLGVMRGRPFACAKIRGSSQYPDVEGEVNFFKTRNGVLVAACIEGLPISLENCQPNIFALHIHEGTECVDGETPFDSAGEHYNPNSCPHPAHSGDLPPLFAGKNGYAYMSVWTDRISLEEIIGKTIIIHGSRDDFTTQPSGDSNGRIACGVIVKN